MRLKAGVQRANTTDAIHTLEHACTLSLALTHPQTYDTHTQTLHTRRRTYDMHPRARIHASPAHTHTYARAHTRCLSGGAAPTCLGRQGARGSHHRAQAVEENARELGGADAQLEEPARATGAVVYVEEALRPA